jgi:hypothetical protein
VKFGDQLIICFRTEEFVFAYLSAYVHSLDELLHIVCKQLYIVFCEENTFLNAHTSIYIYVYKYMHLYSCLYIFENW